MKFKVNDRVKIVLSKPYTIEEIKIDGCHPDANGKHAVISSHGFYPSYELRLEVPLKPHDLHNGTEFNKEFDIYYEFEEELELA